MDNEKNFLKKLRKKIDVLDQELLLVLKKRIDIVNKIGAYKKEKRLPALDKKRWEEVLKSRIKKGKELGLNPEFIKKIFEAIHEEALKVEKKA